MRLYSVLLIYLLAIPGSVRAQRGAQSANQIVIKASAIHDGKGGVIVKACFRRLQFIHRSTSAMF